MREVWSILVKGTNDCNLNCKYCYDKPFREKYCGTILSKERLAKVVDLCSKYAKNVKFIWHGGEPSLLGVDWYVDAQELFYEHYKTKWDQGMQSNGVLLGSDAWIKFLKSYNIEYGISYDGITQNIRENNKDSVKDVLHKFIDNGLNAGGITVINNSNYDKQIELYEFFKKEFDGKYTPTFNHVYRTDGTLQYDLEVEAEKYVEEYSKFFKHWIYDCTDNSREERNAIIMIKQVSGFRENLLCTYSDCRLNWIGVNSNGDIYPCDRYYPDKYYYGNVDDFNSIEEVYKSDGAKIYFEEVEKRYSTICKDCGYLEYCKGLCNANHIAVCGTAEKVDEFSCEIFRQSFNATYSILREIDIYNEFYNMHFVKLFLEASFITVKEIISFLEKKGYKVPEYNEHKDKEIFNETEYKLFRIFNPYRGELLSTMHSNFNQYILPRDVVINNKFNMKQLIYNREKLIEEIYNYDIENIKKVLIKVGTLDE